MRKVLSATVLSTALVFGTVQAEAATPNPRAIFASILKQVRSAAYLTASSVGVDWCFYDPTFDHCI